MPWVTKTALASIADISAATLVSTPTHTQEAVDARVAVTVPPLVSSAIADDPTVADAAATKAAQIAASDLGLVRSVDAGEAAETVIGPAGAEGKTWLQYNIFGEPTSFAARLLWRAIRPFVLAEIPRLVVSPSQPAIDGLIWWIEVDADGRFVALHEGRP